MAERTSLRLFRALQQPICASCRTAPGAATLSPLRPFSQSARILANPGGDDSMSKVLQNVSDSFRPTLSPLESFIPNKSEFGGNFFQNLAKEEWEEAERHHFHVYATKHNTHITLTTPGRDPLISVSCGNIGFRKAGRGTYDAAYQLAAFVMSRIQDKGLLPQIQRLEVIYRGFGPGREAVTKAILGNEGKKIRPLVCRLSDSTRLKFGGVRSKKPRRLG